MAIYDYVKLEVGDGHMVVLKLVLLPTDHDLEADSTIVQMSERKPQRIELRTSANRVVQVDCELPEYPIDPLKAPLERHETPSLDKITHRISQPGIVEVCPGARRKWCKLKYRVSSRSSQSSNQTEKPSEVLRAFTLWRFPTLPGERGFSLEVTSTLIVYIGARRQQDSRKSWPFSERWIQERVNDNKVLKRKTPFYIRKQENAHNESVRDREKIRKQFERGQEKARKRGNDTVFQLDRRLRKGHIDQATFDKEVEKLDTTLGMSYHIYPVVPSSRNRDADACDGHNARPERPRLSSTESIRQSDRNLSQAPNIVREPDSGRHPRAHDSASSGSRRFETWLDSISSIDDHQGRHDKQEPQPNRPAEVSHARTCPIEVPQNAGRKVVRLAALFFGLRQNAWESPRIQARQVRPLLLCPFIRHTRRLAPSIITFADHTTMIRLQVQIILARTLTACPRLLARWGMALLTYHRKRCASYHQ